jgi:hypothetical protein
MRWAAAVLLCAGVAVASGERRVVLVRSQQDSDDSGAALVHAELAAAGFDVHDEVRAAAITGDDLEEVMRRPENVAALSVRPRDGGIVAVVIMTDRETGQETGREIEVGYGGEEGARLLALRVSELLLANSLELSVAEPEPEPPSEPAPSPESAAPAPPPEVRPADEPAPAEPAPAPPEPPPWAVAVGPALMGGPGGIPVGVAPLALLSRQITRRWAVEVMVAAPAVGNVDDASGTAHVDQEMVALRSRVGTGDRPLAPHVTVGAGAYRLGAKGDARAPLAGASASQISFLAILGVGARWWISETVGIVAEVDGSVIAPRPVLRFDGRQGAATAAPLVVGTIAMELAW